MQARTRSSLNGDFLVLWLKDLQLLLFLFWLGLLLGLIVTTFCRLFLDIVLALHVLKQLAISIELAPALLYRAVEWFDIIVSIDVVLQVAARSETYIA